MEDYGPKLCHVLIRNISGEAARSDLETLTEPLRKLVVSHARAKSWLQDALSSHSFISQRVDESQKRIWLQQIIKFVTLDILNAEHLAYEYYSLRGERGTNAIVKEFWMACRGTNLAA